MIAMDKMSQPQINQISISITLSQSKLQDKMPEFSFTDESAMHDDSATCPATQTYNKPRTASRPNNRLHSSKEIWSAGKPNDCLHSSVGRWQTEQLFAQQSGYLNLSSAASHVGTPQSIPAIKEAGRRII
ncbi:hypothetical protein G5I_04829 [Acromyrmex echinatior]|uniref:Uncharacterized protein n=1 Tax=Acromyrmex echinatior TaxID=103372 RepID=F4WGP0_ACREC|nr:hypothetical protein G5I_04829 [Acromyrmex echinatior]